MLSRLKNIGPGAFVAAAFIGPGTVTACILAGANFGYTLLWALVFATVATIILQEMSARLGVITQKGLGEVLRETFAHTIWKWPLFALMISALYLGNAAYEAGNISGAALGIEAITGNDATIYRIAVTAIFMVAAFCLWIGNYKQLEKMLLGLILLMAISFITTFFMVKPDLASLIEGLTIPRTPSGSLMTVIVLIGTTVVPYNLFLHASAVKAHWSGAKDLGQARTDTAISIGLGGLIMISITATAAASIFGSGLQITSAGDMATQFEPLFGPFAKYMLGIGFFAAGISSSITAPLATAYALSEILGFESSVTSRKFRFISLSVLTIGAALALTGIKPISIIIFAQFANGLLLPIIAIFLLLAMNRRSLLGKYANGVIANTLGGIVILITAGLGIRQILTVLGIF
ncbi:MAG: Nramp family divalent metal transporter [Emcibacter sp.]|nr:Nramp family divalent metal transporter [Emcibacter sp.]